MGALSSKLRNVAGGGLTFWCAGCREAHTVWTGQGPGPRWTWNGDVERPVFGPSVLVRTGHYADGKSPADCFICQEHRAHPDDDHGSWRCTICHTYVGCNGAQPGEIIYLSDCTHDLAGKVIPLPDMPQYRERDCGAEGGT
ncbi:DUF6527 family protein [Piscinibacter defluvii]|uniref:DUF6527 family protein n=1 Tax=Piscinibacter defluvii TaxID=1796922 RepID=UPI000FDE875D|nr:DUF6527 family protein [Piscinibacter defluvii]